MELTIRIIKLSPERVALTGQVAGRIEAVEPVAEIIARTVREFAETVEGLAKQLPAS